MAKGRYEYELPSHPVDYGVTFDVDDPDLIIDAQAQRTLNEKRAQKMASEVVPEAIGSIVVSKRQDGRSRIVDGMHRRRMCQLAGIPTIKAEVHHGLSVQEEAVLFLIKNRESSKPSALDEYSVGLTAGLPLFVDTNRVLKDHGLDIGSSSANSVGAVAGVLRVTDTFGADVLDRALTVAEASWGRTAQTWDGVLIGGLGMFIGRHGDLVEKNEDLARKIQKAGTAGLWISRVHTLASSGGMHNTGTGSRVSTCYAMIKREWNKQRRKNVIPD